MRSKPSRLTAGLISSALLAATAVAWARPSLAQQQVLRPRPDLSPREFQQYAMQAAPTALNFEAVSAGQQVSLQVTIANTGLKSQQLNSLGFFLGASGSSSAFKVTIDGTDYFGSTNSVVRPLTPPVTFTRGQRVHATVTFAPTEQVLDSFRLYFMASNGIVEVPVSGLGGHSGDPYLHVVIDGPSWVVDYDVNGSQAVVLDGTGAHTHEPGHALAAYEWRVEGQLTSTTSSLSTVLTEPESQIELKIFDDNVPAHVLADQTSVRVVPPDQVPGVLAFYYDASASGASALLDNVPASADFVEQRASMNVGGTGQVGGSPFDGNVMVRLVGKVTVEAEGIYVLTAVGGGADRLFVNGTLVTGPIFLSGEEDVEARFAVDALADLPLDVELTLGGSGGPIPADALSHDETGVIPVIHAMTESGVIAGGDLITIDGFGFFTAEQVVVHWGGMDLIDEDFTSLTPQRIQFLSPPGGGSIAVSVENANGTSNVRTFLYQLSGPPPIQFRRDLIASVPAPTAGVFGPDGKLYVASLDGRISVLEFDEDYDLVSQTIHTGVSGLSNYETLSLAINPFDPPSPVKLYVGHGDHYLHGGNTPTTFSPYTGQISVLTGPNFNSPTALITGLPVSNHDHAIAGLAFDNNGDLLISVGSATNAGVKALGAGDLPESPLSAAVLKARLSTPGFDGTITYVETVSGLPNDDQRYGEIVDVVPGPDVEVQAAGLRNAYGLAFTTGSRLYATDNGPNTGLGPASTGPTTQGPDPYDDDELNLIEWGNYYGSPNRNRGRTDSRQNIYGAGLAGPPSVPDTFFQMIAWLPPSSDGIDEYRANTFEGQIRGQLIVQEFQNKLRRVRLKADGRGTLGQAVINPNTGGLGCATGPGGAIVAFDYEHSEVEILEADDLTPTELVVHDIFPWRAPASGGTPFVIAGRGFGTLATTSVTIGGLAASLSEVGWSRIKGTFPTQPNPTTSLLDVVVTVGGQPSTLTAAFRYLFGSGLEPGRWETLASIGTPIGEVAAGVINGTLYLVGEGSGLTFAYDLQNRQWLGNKAIRPYTGHHHAAEVVAGKLYLIGGIDGGSEGRVQIYDPVANSWTSGTDMTWSGGSVSTAVIGGKIYAAGGIAGGFTVVNCAEYDPVANTWTAKASMPDLGRNHAASATDGSKLYVFGGRRGGNFVANGYDSLMVYDPLANSWTWSGASSLAPLPEARGGMGKAVWFRGEFYVFGGETLDDPDANLNHVYDRVDVYDPALNSWRLEAKMPNPRHGIFPVLYQGHMFLAGGGTQSANSQTTLFDTFTRQ